MSMDQSAGVERARVVQDERAAERTRGRAAQDQEVAKRVEQYEQQWQTDNCAWERARVASSDAVIAAHPPPEIEGKGDSSNKPDGTQQKDVTRSRSTWVLRPVERDTHGA